MVSISKLKINKIVINNNSLEKRLFQKRVENIYYSFWLGIFFNMFIKKGKKKKIFRQLYISLLQLKYKKKISPLIYLFEILERSKTTFKLERWFPIRTLIIYPKILLRDKQYKFSIFRLTKYFKKQKKMTRRIKLPFYRFIYDTFENLYSNKANELIKRRDKIHSEAMHLQDNIRYPEFRLKR